jgi:hypothetical protein
VTPPTVVEVLRHDRWAAAEGRTETGPWLLRFRTPVLLPGEGGEHRHRLSVLWAYGPEASGELPSEADAKAMGVFEDRLCGAWERDGLAFLSAVLTFDGARQWLFYTYDVSECGQRLNDMPQEEERYPIELTADEDPTWDFLHSQMLKRLDWSRLQEGWRQAFEKARPKN